MSNMFKQVKEFHKAYGLPMPKKLADFEQELFDLRAKLISEEAFELSDEMETYAKNQSNLDRVVKETADLVYVLLGYMISIGVPFDKCFDEVHRSNMSKLGEDGKPIYREDGKVLKGPNYSKADIQKILDGAK